jgi:hypothetical protein
MYRMMDTKQPSRIRLAEAVAAIIAAISVIGPRSHRRLAASLSSGAAVLLENAERSDSARQLMRDGAFKRTGRRFVEQNASKSTSG